MNINLYNGLSPAAKEILGRLANSGSSESIAVAECLNDIASNAEQEKEEFATEEELSSQDSHLITCAKEIIDAAQAVIDALQVAPAAADLLKLFESKGLDESALDDTVHDMASGAGSNANNGGPQEQIAYLIRECGVTETRKIIEGLA